MEIRTNVRIGGNCMKRYVIKNKVRFLISISIVMIFALSSIFTLAVSARGEREVTMLSEYVEAGDTLWELSKEYAGDMEIREYISRVIEINDLSGANIKPGELLYFPVFK